MIADALRIEIELYARQMRASNPLFLRAAEGAISREVISTYLANVAFVIRETLDHISLAAKISRERGQPGLAAHYENKRREEAGHDAWAESDLKQLSPPSSRQAILPSIHRLMALHVDWIQEDPAHFLSYMLFSEYLITLVGPEWLALLESNCGIPVTAMTVISTHAELDKHHVEEALDVIDEMVGDPTKLAIMRDVLRTTFQCFDLFCAELTGETCDEKSYAEAAGPRVHAA